MDHEMLTVMADCVVCAAFPDHEGKHYMLREVHSRFRYARLRSLGKTKWVELLGCESANSYPILATAHMTDHPGAHNVAPGCSLCEKTPDFDPDEKIAGKFSEDDEGTAEDSERADQQQKIAEHHDASLDEVGQLTQEDRLMANSDSKGCLTWTDSGLQVQIQAVHNGTHRPDVAALKKALSGFEPPESVLVTITETLGRGQAWVTVAVGAGAQADLLIVAGTLVDYLVKAGVYEEVVLSGSS